MIELLQKSEGGLKVVIEHNNTFLGEGVLQELDKGIEDMGSGRELLIEKAFDKITDLRKRKRDETK